MFIDLIARGEEKKNLAGLRRPLSAPLRHFDTVAAAMGGGSQAYRWLETPPRGSLTGVLNPGVTRAGPDVAPNLTVLGEHSVSQVASAARYSREFTGAGRVASDSEMTFQDKAMPTGLQELRIDTATRTWATPAAADRSR